MQTPHPFPHTPHRCKAGPIEHCRSHHIALLALPALLMNSGHEVKLAVGQPTMLIFPSPGPACRPSPHADSDLARLSRAWCMSSASSPLGQGGGPCPLAGMSRIDATSLQGGSHSQDCLGVLPSPPDSYAKVLILKTESLATSWLMVHEHLFHASELFQTR